MVLNFNLLLIFFIKMVQNFNMNFTSQSFTITLGMPMSLTHMLKNNFVVSILVAFILVNSNLANLENLSTTTKMAAFSYNNGRHVMKSIQTPSKGLVGIEKANIQTNSFFKTWFNLLKNSCTCANIVFHIFFHVNIVKAFVQCGPHGLLSTMAHQKHIVHSCTSCMTFVHNFPLDT